MSRYSLQHLAENTAIGHGYRSWWADAAEAEGLVYPTYAGHVPEDKVISVITEDLRTETLMGNETGATIESHVRVYNHVTGETMQIAGSKYEVHLPLEWCYEAALPVIEAAKSEGLGVFSAISLGGGMHSAITLAYEDKTKAADMELMPYTCFSTGAGGDFATQLNNGVTAPVCDNTIMLGRESGTILKVRHTAGSRFELEELIRKALELHSYVDVVKQRIEMLAAIPVNAAQWDAMITGLLGERDPDASKQSKAIRTSSETRIRNLASFDPRCAPWEGTALGSFQTMNTWQQHMQTVSGRHRAERNVELAVSGKQADIDAQFLAIIGNALDLELV